MDSLAGTCYDTQRQGIWQMYAFFCCLGGGSVRFAAGLKRVQWCSQRGCGLWQGDNSRGRRIRTDHGGGILSTGVKKEELCTVTQLAVVSRLQLLCDFWRDHSCVFQCCSHLWCEIVHSCERGTYGQLALSSSPVSWRFHSYGII